jgi:hypothetical protein
VIDNSGKVIDKGGTLRYNNGTLITKRANSIDEK